MDRQPGFFDYGGPLMRFFQGVVDLILLNILFLVGCLPVITAGASLLALYDVSISHCREGRQQSSVRQFLDAYRRHLKTGIPLTLICTVVFASLLLDYFFLESAEAYSVFDGVMLGSLFAASTILGMLASYYFPLMSSGEYRLWDGTQIAFQICFRHWKKSLPLSLLTISAVLLCLHVPVVFVGLLPVMLLIGFALIALLVSLYLHRTLPQRN